MIALYALLYLAALVAIIEAALSYPATQDKPRFYFASGDSNKVFARLDEIVDIEYIRYTLPEARRRFMEGTWSEPEDNKFLDEADYRRFGKLPPKLHTVPKTNKGEPRP